MSSAPLFPVNPNQSTNAVEGLVSAPSSFPINPNQSFASQVPPTATGGKIRNLNQTVQEREIIKTAPDLIIYLDGKTYLLNPYINDKANGNTYTYVSFNDYVQNFSMSCDTDQLTPGANFTLLVPNHMKYLFQSPGGNNLIDSMMEVQVFAKGYFPSTSGNTIYHRVFKGMTAHIGHTDNGVFLEISVQCLGIMHLLEYMYMDVQTALVSNSNRMTTSFSTNQSGMNPYEQLADTLLRGITFEGFQLNTMQQGQNVATSQWNQSVKAGYCNKWQPILVNLRKEVHIAGYYPTSLPVDIDGYSRYSPDAKGKFDPDVLAASNTVYAKIPKTKTDPDFYVDIIRQYLPDTNINDIQLVNGRITSRLARINTILALIGYEGFQDLDGTLVFKPPLYNLDVTKLSYATDSVPAYDPLINITEETNPFVVHLSEIESESESEDEQAIKATRMTVQPNVLPSLQLAGAAIPSSLLIPVTHIDIPKLAKFGLREEPARILPWVGPDKFKLYTYAVSEMNRMNRGWRQYTITIPLRPELKLGFPMYLPHKDMYGYIKNISISYSQGGAATMTILLDTIRKRPLFPESPDASNKNVFYVTKPNLVMEWTTPPGYTPPATTTATTDSSSTPTTTPAVTQALAAQQAAAANVTAAYATLKTANAKLSNLQSQESGYSGSRRVNMPSSLTSDIATAKTSVSQAQAAVTGAQSALTQAQINVTKAQNAAKQSTTTPTGASSNPSSGVNQPSDSSGTPTNNPATMGVSDADLASATQLQSTDMPVYSEVMEVLANRQNQFGTSWSTKMDTTSKCFRPQDDIATAADATTYLSSYSHPPSLVSAPLAASSSAPKTKSPPSKVQAAVKAAQASADAANKQAASATTEYNNAKQAVTNAQQAVTKAEQAYTKDEANYVLFPSVSTMHSGPTRTQVEAAKAALDTAKQNLKNAQNHVEWTKTTALALQAAADTANKNLQDAQKAAKQGASSTGAATTPAGTFPIQAGKPFYSRDNWGQGTGGVNSSYMQKLVSSQPYTDEGGYELVTPFPWGRWKSLAQCIYETHVMGCVPISSIGGEPTSEAVTSVSGANAFLFAGVGSPSTLAPSTNLKSQLKTLENVSSLAASSTSFEIITPTANTPQNDLSNRQQPDMLIDQVSLGDPAATFLSGGNPPQIDSSTALAAQLKPVIQNNPNVVGTTPATNPTLSQQQTPVSKFLNGTS